MHDLTVQGSLGQLPYAFRRPRNNGPVLLQGLTELLLAETRKETCQLLGNLFGYLVQFSLGILAFSSLLYKHWREYPPRSFVDFARDSSKQGVAALMAHGMNMLFAALLSSEDESPCLYYLVNVLVESLLGLALNLLVLQAVEYATLNWFGSQNLQSGFYGEKPRTSIWMLQLLVYCAIVIVVKLLLLFCIIIPLQTPLYRFGDWLMSPFHPYPKLELMIVMVVVPLFVNVASFWVTDNFLMFTPSKQARAEQAHSRTSSYAKLPTTADHSDHSADHSSHVVFPPTGSSRQPPRTNSVCSKVDTDSCLHSGDSAETGTITVQVHACNQTMCS